jgi:hypothetical protein
VYRFDSSSATQHETAISRAVDLAQFVFWMRIVMLPDRLDIAVLHYALLELEEVFNSLHKAFIVFDVGENGVLIFGCAHSPSTTAFKN